MAFEVVGLLRPGSARDVQRHQTGVLDAARRHTLSDAIDVRDFLHRLAPYLALLGAHTADLLDTLIFNTLDETKGIVMVKQEPVLILLHGGKLGSNANVIPILVKAGHTYRSVGKLFGVSGQRVQQIAKKNNMLDVLYLVAERKRAATRRLEMERIERAMVNKRGLTKWIGYGLSTEEQHRLKRLRTKYRNLKKKCDTLGLLIDIKFEDIEWPTHCPVFGFELDYSYKSGINNRDRAPSFDQILPAAGYVKGNVQVISYRANRIKNDATPQELKQLADYMSALTGG